MFILRRLAPPDQLEINTYIGIDYVLILKEKNSEEFKNQTMQWEPEDLINVYGIITFDIGDEIIPLYNDGSLYYIMTNDGKTFSNISYKKRE